MKKALDRRVGETNLNKQGRQMTITAYYDAKNITVVFPDGSIAKNKTYRSFVRGLIRQPGNDPYGRCGEKNTNTKGHLMTIEAYHSYNNIDVKFEDGSIVRKRTYKSFLDGLIKHPKQNVFDNKKYYNETIKNKQDLDVTIIKRHSYTCIDVTFSDGKIIKNETYHNFKNGLILHPDHEYLSKIQKERLKEQNINNQGLIMTIICYRKARDIDIMFEDNTIVKNKSYHNFKKGAIRNPNAPINRKKTKRRQSKKTVLQTLPSHHDMIFDIAI